MTYLFDELDQVYIKTKKPKKKNAFILSIFLVVVIPPQKKARKGNMVPKSA